MAHLIAALQDLKTLAPEVHLLCPRQNDEDFNRYEEDFPLAEAGVKSDIDTLTRVGEAQERRKKFIASLQLLAYDGKESEQYQKFIWDRLDDAMGKCDLCIRNYYVAKLSLLAELREEYDEEEIAQFFSIIDRRDIQRIADALCTSTAKLKALPEEKRKLRGIDPRILYPVYEALSCDAFLEDDNNLQKYFDEPFKLLQSKITLKTRDYMPAATRFLFDSNNSRFQWAEFTWKNFLRPPTEVEWAWAAKRTVEKLLREAASPRSIYLLWRGLSRIVLPLSQKEITYQLFDLQPNVCTTALNHLARRDQGLRFILQTLCSILWKAPEAFWEQLGSISSSTVVEQVFASPDFDKHLQDFSKSHQSPDSGPSEKHLGHDPMVSTLDTSPSEDMLLWIWPFLRSLKPANQAPACQTLTMQLSARIGNNKLPVQVRQICYDATVQVILKTLRSFTDNESTRQSVARVVLSDTLDTVSQHIDRILKPAFPQLNDPRLLSSRDQALNLVRNALNLECQCLKIDFELLNNRKSLPHGHSSYSPDIWNAVIRSLDDQDKSLSKAALSGSLPLPGLEKFLRSSTKELSKEKQSFNSIFGKITGLFGQILEKLSEFSPEHLDGLFNDQETSMPLVAALFSADDKTYHAAIELIKNLSEESERREAMAHLMDGFLSTVLLALCWTYRRIARMKTFASVPQMMKTGMDVLDILCDAQNGLLRKMKLKFQRFQESQSSPGAQDSQKSQKDQKARKAEMSWTCQAVEKYWQFQWNALGVVFEYTEEWALKVQNKNLMIEVCRDAMQYAEHLFEQYDVFADMLTTSRSGLVDEVPTHLLRGEDGSPAKTLDFMCKWLRLRDEFLVDTCVKLVAKLLRRLEIHDVPVSTESLAYIQKVTEKSAVKTMLSGSQKAHLIRALEAYYKKPLEATIPKKQSTLHGWAGTVTDDHVGTSTPASRQDSGEDYTGEADVTDDYFYQLSGRSTEIRNAQLGAREEQTKFREASRRAATIQAPAKTLLQKDGSKAEQPVKPMQRKQDDVASFLATRRREQEAAEARRKEASAALRERLGIGSQTKGQGSGLAALGVKGKDHVLADESLMVSSDSESESDDELDHQLFGSRPKPINQNDIGLFKGMIKAVPVDSMHRPVRKIRQVRTQKNIKARMEPDLSDLHRTILGWDFFADVELPPGSDDDDYTLVTNTFRTAEDYRKTFKPLLTLEGWQSFRSAKEDGSFKPFEAKAVNRLTSDGFVEISATMSAPDTKELGISIADIVLLSKSKQPGKDVDQPRCLARVKDVGRKKGQLEVVFTVSPHNNTLLPSMSLDATIWGIHILSLTPLEREYGALMALEYYDLCEEIITAKPSPILDYSDQDLQSIVQTYEVNIAQAKAVKSALDNDAFTLIQGPPGSGKTKTICALVGAMMTGSLNGSLPPARNSTGISGRAALTPAAKRVLVCAPSNAAVDELVMRFKQGVRTTDGATRNLTVVRLGRSDAINANVKDVTLEELLNSRLKTLAPKDPNEKDIHEIMMEHKATSDELHALRSEMDKSRAQGQPIKPEQEHRFEGLKRKKTQLSQQIDNARDRAKVASRDAELIRKRMQQEILDSAHVLCATLSGSGHEIFQTLCVEFDTVIIDEAAQSIELSALIPLKYGCTKCVLVGDPKQLPPTVLSREAARFQYEQSLFARMEKNHPRDVHLLDTQYRMHPEISLFPSKTFYDGRLKDGLEMARLRFRPWHNSALLAPYRFFDVEGMQQSVPKGHSLVNIAELNVAMQLFERLTKDCGKYDFQGRIGIITPYKGQLKELKSRFSQRYGPSILSSVEFNTTDAFQGRESEVIIFSCVRASTNGIGFLNDVRRMNVGLTRAKCSLWVLGNSQALVQGEFWRALVQDAKSRNLYTAGDIASLLRRPLLTEDMMKEDIDMVDLESSLDSSNSSRKAPDKVRSTAEATSPTPLSSIPVTEEANASIKSGGPVGRTNLPSRGTNTLSQTVPSPMSTTSVTRENKTEASKESLEPRPREGVYGPSGGRFGFNPHAMCNICGSDNHFTHACDNLAAREASLGSCHRCKAPGHTMRSCPAPRCLECGEVGHLADQCPAAPDDRLGPVEKETAKAQEKAFRRDQDRARERRAERLLGEHAAKVPVVKTSLPSGPRATAPLSAATGDVKRKRGGSAPGSPWDGAKAMKTEHDHIHSGSEGGSTARVGAKHEPAAGLADLSGLDAPARNGGAGKAGGLGRALGGAPTVIKKKKPRDDDMFMKRK